MNLPPNTVDLIRSSTQTDQSEKRRLVVVTSGKGGTGTSFFSRVLSGYFASRKREVIAVDTHYARSTFFKFLRDDTTCRYCDLGAADAFEPLIKLCLDHKLVLMDLTSGAYDHFARWLLHSEFPTLAQGRDFELTIFFMLSGEPETVAIISRNLEILKDIGQPIAVRNMHNFRGPLSEDQTRESTGLAGATAMIDLPELGGGVQTLLRLMIPFRDAIPEGSQHQGRPGLANGRMQRFWELTESQLARIEMHLL